MSTEDEVKKKRAKALKFLKQEFGLDEVILDNSRKEKRRKRQCFALRRILRTYMGVLSIKKIYENMVLWCDANDKDPSVFYLNKWLEQRLEWDAEKNIKENGEGPTSDERRKKTQEILEELREQRRHTHKSKS